jgi:hypothetical protein
MFPLLYTKGQHVTLINQAHSTSWEVESSAEDKTEQKWWLGLNNFGEGNPGD